MNIKNYFFTFIFLISFKHAFSTSEDLDSETLAKFKIGLELQEGSRLVAGNPLEEPQPLYKYNPLLQKKDIFVIKELNSDKSLFKVEIDTQDIEFVTYPFSNSEKELLITSLQFIEVACKNLKECFNSFTNDYFEFAQNKIEPARRVKENIKKYKNYELLEDEREKYEQDNNIVNENFSGSFVTFETWRKRLEENDNFQVLPSEDFDYFKDTIIFIKRASFPAVEALRSIDFLEKIQESEFMEDYQNWMPLFKPQLTVQLPLEKVIFFLFELYKERREEIQKFLNFLPDVEQIENYQAFLSPFQHNEYIDIKKYSFYQDKKLGLLFLHALTLFNLIPNKLLKEPIVYQNFLHDFKASAQVDAKSLLSVVSRRPFNEMWHQIKKENTDEYNLNELNNENFSKRVNPSTFSRMDYAREFFIEDKRQDFQYLLKARSISDEIKPFLKPLFKYGVLPLSVIIKREEQEWKERFWEEYFENACDLNKEEYRRYYIELEEKEIRIEQKEVGYDALSPPWFLDDSAETGDAMGHLRKDLLSKFGDYESDYGEAIIEIRNIDVFKEINDESFFKDLECFLTEVFKILQ